MNKMHGCHIMMDSVSELDIIPLRNHFKLIKTLIHESHLFRYIIECRVCGQLYFFEFYEVIDWKEGKDSQYSTFIPITNLGQGELLNKKSQFELLGIVPRLQNDFVGDDKTTKWMR